MSTLYFFLQAIPECMGVIALSLAFAQVPLRWGLILKAGSVLSLINYGMRKLPLDFGVHIPVSILLIFLLIIRLTTAPASRAIISVFSGFITLVIIEMAVSSTFFAYTHMTYVQAVKHEGLWCAVGVFQSIILGLIAIIAARLFKSSRSDWKL
jgi:hypothetical protein